MAIGRRAWRTVQGALLIGLGALLLSACSRPDPFAGAVQGPPLPVIAHDAVTAFRAARTVQIRGSYRRGSVPVTVRLSLRPSTGAVSGRATYNGSPLQVVGRGGKTYTKGLRYWQSEGAQGLHIWPRYGAGWVLAPSGDPGGQAVADAGDLGGLLDQLDQDAPALVSEGTSEFQGQAIASLRDGHTIYDVTSSAPYRLVALHRTGSSASAGGVRDLNLQIHYGGRLKVKLPGSGQYVDPRDASTFPALYEVQSTSALQSCDSSSCGYTATLVNTTGREQGQVTATLALFADAAHTQPVGSCTVPVPQVATGQTTTVSCRISGAGYQSYYFSLVGSSDIYQHVTITNPPYN
ncbi:MAG: hypothetical protein J2P38_01590 [Candidatus Dormibacteraeota bacterium]|nr:hypothetical protein [Candidatus Dormibacteraeota bacterium]